MVRSVFSSFLLAMAAITSAFPSSSSNLEARQSSDTPIALTNYNPHPNIVANFPAGTWIENLVPRSQDGNFVATSLSSPDLYLISSTNVFPPKKIAHFPGNLGALGIVELGRDVFYVVVGNFSVTTFTSSPGTYSVWEINLNGIPSNDNMHDPHAPHQVTTRKVADFPHAGLLNGLTVLNPIEGVVLIGDSLHGSVWSLNVWTGHTSQVISDKSMAPHPDLSGGLSLGVNGISFFDGNLYYDNSNTVTFYRIPVNATTGVSTGPAQALAKNEFANIIPDDFTLDAAGNIWFACQYGHVALLSGATAAAPSIPAFEVVVKNVTTPNGFTAAKFGITETDLKRGSLYVTTNGNTFSYGTGHGKGGQLVRYDTAPVGFF